jgi:hypothetical protein
MSSIGNRQQQILRFENTGYPGRAPPREGGFGPRILLLGSSHKEGRNRYLLVLCSEPCYSKCSENMLDRYWSTYRMPSQQMQCYLPNYGGWGE